MTMNEKDYNWIEAFLNGELNAEDTKRFRERISREPEFREAYELRKSMNIYLKGKKGKEALQLELARIAESDADITEDPEIKKSKVVPLRKRLLQYAAAVAALLIIVWIFYMIITPKNLYQQYADIPQMKLTQMGQESTLTQAEQAYNSKDYSLAYEKLKAHLNSTPDDINAYYYLGLSALESDRFSEALDIFKSVDSGTSAYQVNAKWWMAMTYLKMDDLDKCRSTLEQIPESSDFYDNAQELLGKLKK